MQRSGLLAPLIRGAGTALTIQVVSAGVLYGSHLLLARWMGTTEYGIYDYASAVGLLLAFAAGFGLPTAVLRLIPTYQVREDWALLRGMIWGSWQQTCWVGAIASICGTIAVLGVDATRSLGAYTLPLAVGMWAIPVLALTNLQLEIARAFHQIVLAYAPSLLVQPLLLTIAAAVWQLRQDVTSTVAIALSLLATLLALALQGFLFHRSLDANIRTVRPAYDRSRWRREALPLLLVGGSHIILNRTDTLTIGALLSAKEVG
ncbi:MAG: flippase, partial [Cyanobacteria bacterium J06639_1]